MMAAHPSPMDASAQRTDGCFRRQRVQESSVHTIPPADLAEGTTTSISGRDRSHALCNVIENVA
jgi:hypothetical protein